jgi:anaerobic selenocysteine-containing dehydrogenase
VARLYGTNHVNNCSFYCHQASGVGLTSVIGSGAGTVTLDDMEHADMVILLGGNPAAMASNARAHHGHRGV